MTALTPDDLARIEARADLEAEGWHSSRPDDSVCVQSRADVLALVAGVRSLQARITELETEKADAWDEGWDNGNDYALSDSFDGRASRENNPHRAGTDL